MPPRTRKAPRQPVASKSLGASIPMSRGERAPPVLGSACASASLRENQRPMHTIAEWSASEWPTPTSTEYVRRSCHGSATSALSPQPSVVTTAATRQQRRLPYLRTIAPAMMPPPSMRPIESEPTSAVTCVRVLCDVCVCTCERAAHALCVCTRDVTSREPCSCVSSSAYIGPKAYCMPRVPKETRK
eukprot:scaffold3458_cov66-Phaeocystis_antarctica.AAC.7